MDPTRAVTVRESEVTALDRPRSEAGRRSLRPGSEPAGPLTGHGYRPRRRRRVTSALMGQMVSVVEKRSSTPGIIRFEANRTLTGQGHERFTSADEAIGPRPAAELARRLFATGQVEGLHVYSNMVTVNLARGFAGEGLYDIVRELYQYWKPGMEPAVFVEEAPAEVAAVSSGGEGGAGPSAYEQLVPEILRERSKAALAKWKAANG